LNELAELGRREWALYRRIADIEAGRRERLSMGAG
jgi:hypothetical protein